MGCGWQPPLCLLCDARAPPNSIHYLPINYTLILTRNLHITYVTPIFAYTKHNHSLLTFCIYPSQKIVENDQPTCPIKSFLKSYKQTLI